MEYEMKLSFTHGEVQKTKKASMMHYWHTELRKVKMCM